MHHSPEDPAVRHEPHASGCAYCPMRCPEHVHASPSGCVSRTEWGHAGQDATPPFTAARQRLQRELQGLATRVVSAEAHRNARERLCQSYLPSSADGCGTHFPEAWGLVPRFLHRVWAKFGVIMVTTGAASGLGQTTPQATCMRHVSLTSLLTLLTRPTAARQCQRPVQPGSQEPQGRS